MTEVGKASRPLGRDDVVFREMVDEWVIFDPVTRNLHVLNHIAALIWHLCDGEMDEDGMVEALTELVEEAPEPAVIRQHVRETLETFQREGLLRG